MPTPSCLTPPDFERRTRGVMTLDERERFDTHLRDCARCHAAYDAFLIDQQFLAGARGALADSGTSDTLVVTPAAKSSRSEGDSAMLDIDPRSTTPGPPPPRDYLPRIEGYQVLRIIGRGGMGVVYEAVQEKLQRRVALKLLPALVSSAHPDVVTRFQREATAAARLHHTNIIPIYDFGESRDGYFYAMELIHGQPLSTLIKVFSTLEAPMASQTTLAAALQQAPGSWTGGVLAVPAAEPSSGSGGTSTTNRGRPYYLQVARWVADAAEALHYAHLHGLVHRDIKPSNLMVCTDGRIVVLDFGLVKSESDHSVTMTGSLVGTYRYMSPEQIGAKRITVDARSDIYSLGATLYELLAFQPAFPATEQSELLSTILFKDPVAPKKLVPAVPVDLQTICLKALEKAPNSRYQTARALADDLRQYLADRPIVARPLGVVGRTARFFRRHKTQTVTVLVTIALIGAGLAGKWTWDRSRAEQFLSTAQARFQNGEYKTAMDLCQRAIELRADFEPARSLLVDSTVRCANQAALGPGLDSARPALIAAGNQLPIGGVVSAAPASPDVEALMNVGVAAMNKGDLLTAEQVFADALARAPGSFRALVNLATVKKDLYYRESRSELLSEADALLTRAIEIEPGRVEPWNVRGIIRRTEGKLDSAIDAFENAKNLKPDYFPIWVNLGALHALKGDLVAAEKCLIAGVELPEGCKSGMNWRHLAAVRMQLGRAQADEAIKKTLECNPGDEVGLLLRARSLLSGNLDGSVEAAREAAMDADKRTESAQQTARQSGKKDTLLAWVKRVLAVAQLRDQAWTEAITAAEAALAFGDPVPAFAHLVKAVAESRRGNTEAARRAYDDAIKAWPKEWEQVGFKAQLESKSKALWIDSIAELTSLRQEAEGLVPRGLTP